MNNIKHLAYFDLDANEVSMRIHRILKEMEVYSKYKFVTIFIEKSHEDILEREEYVNDRVETIYRQVQKYVLHAILSVYLLSKDELLFYLKRMRCTSKHSDDYYGSGTS